MSYRFEAGRIYRMPTHFGPAPGPRQLPSGVVVDPKRSPSRLSVTASFLTEGALLERHLPEGFSLSGEPVVTVEFHYMTDIDWLAGRGYTMIHVGWPARFTGKRDQAAGRFLAVVWENLADPIITGRDEIGHPKLYADIAEPRRFDGVQLCTAGWMGFRFLELAVSECRDAPSNEPRAASDGTLMLKYVPRTGDWGEAELRQVTLTPLSDPDRSLEKPSDRHWPPAIPPCHLVGSADHVSCGECTGGIACLGVARGDGVTFTGRKTLSRPASLGVICVLTS